MLIIYLLLHFIFSIVAYIFVRHTCKEATGASYTIQNRIINLTFSIIFSWIWFIIILVLSIPESEKQSKKHAKW
jgi:hypothetical protein